MTFIIISESKLDYKHALNRLLLLTDKICDLLTAVIKYVFREFTDVFSCHDLSFYYCINASNSQCLRKKHGKMVAVFFIAPFWRVFTGKDFFFFFLTWHNERISHPLAMISFASVCLCLYEIIGLTKKVLLNNC